MFDLSIDSDSYKNIIDKHITDKLKLSLKPHPKSYKIGWIKGREKIKIIQYCKVSFYVRKYMDEIYYDDVEITKSTSDQDIVRNNTLMKLTGLMKIA